MFAGTPLTTTVAPAQRQATRIRTIIFVLTNYLKTFNCFVKLFEVDISFDQPLECPIAMRGETENGWIPGFESRGFHSEDDNVTRARIRLRSRVF